MSHDLGDAVAAWRRYAESLEGIGGFFPGMQQCGLSIGEVGTAIQYSESADWPLLPIMADGVRGDGMPSNTINFLLTTHWISSQVGGLLKERFMRKQRTLVTDEIRKECESLVKDIDYHVNMYTKHLVDKQIYRTLGSLSSDKLQVGAMWVDRAGNQLPGTQVAERAIMKSDLRHCPAALAFCGVIEDDTVGLFRGRPHPVLVMPSGMWRNQGMPDEGCEAYIIDISPAVTRAVRTAVQKHGISDTSDMVTTYAAKAGAINDSMGGVPVMLAYAGQILEATAKLASFMLAYGFATKEEGWLDVFMTTGQKIVEVIRHELTAEDNPDALFEIGGWS